MRTLGGPQSWSERGSDVKISQSLLSGSRTPVYQPVAHSIYWLTYRGSSFSWCSVIGKDSLRFGFSFHSVDVRVSALLLVKSEVKVVSLNWASHHAGVLGSGGIAPCILWPRHKLRWVVSFTPHRPLYAQVNSPVTHWIGGWVGPKAGLDAVVRRKIPSPCRESNPRTPIV
jgi:hypothetical protein